jgi:hypothetical protein
VAGPMAKLMERGRIEVSSVLESLEAGQADDVGARPIVRLAGALPYAGASAREKFINRGGAFVGIARLTASGATILSGRFSH